MILVIKIKLKKKVKHILEIHNIISQLNYDKKDIEEIIENNINNINNKIVTLNNNYTDNYTDNYIDDYDELNSIINC